LEKEVIVVDDGSNDGSLEIIKRFGDRIRWETVQTGVAILRASWDVEGQKRWIPLGR